jgi:hypothetical protein
MSHLDLIGSKQVVTQGDLEVENAFLTLKCSARKAEVVAKPLHLFYRYDLVVQKINRSMGTVVFDSDGRGWDARSPALRAVFQRRIPRFDVLTYLVDVLGCVAVTTTRRGIARIRLRPAHVSQVSLGAALFAVADERPQWIVVSHPSDRCRDELFPSVGRAFDRIAELVEHTQGDAPPLSAADEPEHASPVIGHAVRQGRVADHQALFPPVKL